ncbi:DUF742 domain-containing protein [Yinghuangia seranimata]|uniref:DUF742 domain-containing protein n=1 Tax=Yinghuangia seranimata TaxID=408067 RepID=UPI00248B6368|nr:DUF742 domain-containing protein [Yinghuangia seranimata]MDI2132003.1 DUF742 domain-containing protein [Yinghuangia seranimata]
MSADKGRYGHAWDEDAGPLVRPYTLTRGRTRAAHADLTLITLVTTVEPVPDDREAGGLHPEELDILRLCVRPQAVAEVAALVHLPVSVVKILLGDLVNAGRMTARAPLSMAQAPNAELLRKVRDGLGRL